MYYLGLTSGNHDSAAALVQGGRVVAAAQEERFDRQKHSAAFPEQAVRYCLEQAGITMADVSGVGFYWRPVLSLQAKAWWLVRYFPRSLGLLQNGLNPRNFVKALTIEKELGARFRQRVAPVRHHDHHLTHAASAFLPSPFERAAILTMDGSGESLATGFHVGEGAKIRRCGGVPFPHSLGHLYSAVTEYLGFAKNDAEGTVMSLAAYGAPCFRGAFAKILRITPGSHPRAYQVDWRYFSFALGDRQWYSAELQRLLGPPRPPGAAITRRHMDIAASLQLVLEEAVLSLAAGLCRHTGQEALCLAGGLALNCVANGRLLREGGIGNIFIQPAANDAGCSVGAALLSAFADAPGTRREPLSDAYLGPGYTDDDCLRAINAERLHCRRHPRPARAAARLLAQGCVIGWFQGRMEFGPRALGNRSILADPRRPEMGCRVNQRVKFRETFRPFSPSVLCEEGDALFEQYVPSPYMLFAFRTKPGVAARMPAVVHVDGTARAQTVRRSENSLFYDLIAEFRERTGLGAVLNTSFNLKGEPLVCTPRDAINTFRRSQMDHLFLGPYCISKRDENRPR